VGYVNCSRRVHFTGDGREPMSQADAKVGQSSGGNVD